MLLDPSNAVITEISAGLKEITDGVLRWAIPLAAVGSVSMAFIQAAKNVTPIRNWFQRVRLRKWLLESIRRDYGVNEYVRIYKWLRMRFQKRSQDEERQREIERELLRKVEKDLICLATSCDKDAFYDLPIDDLCAQIRKIVSVVLDYPNFHRELLCCLARGASPEDLATILKEQGSQVLGGSNQSVKDEKDVFREFAEAKSRILVQVRCAVDAIQTSIGFRWKFWLQLISMILSGVLGVAALNLGILVADKVAMSKTTKFWTSLLIGLLAGFLAPVARDLVAALEKLRS